MDEFYVEVICYYQGGRVMEIDISEDNFFYVIGCYGF
jgi:hypothetical protein